MKITATINVTQESVMKLRKMLEAAEMRLNAHSKLESVEKLTALVETLGGKIVASNVDREKSRLVHVETVCQYKDAVSELDDQLKGLYAAQAQEIIAEFDARPSFTCCGGRDRRHRRFTIEERQAMYRFNAAGIPVELIAKKFSCCLASASNNRYFWHANPDKFELYRND
jgi:acetolactate synthase regulatory subunit